MRIKNIRGVQTGERATRNASGMVYKDEVSAQQLKVCAWEQEEINTLLH